MTISFDTNRKMNKSGGEKSRRGDQRAIIY